MFDKCNEIFIDGTFNMAPKKLLLSNFKFFGDIWIRKIYIPLMYWLMTSKNIIAYNYERAFRLSINSIFKLKTLNGCFFYFSKALWKKYHDYGLTKKNIEKNVQFWHFALNYFPIFTIIIEGSTLKK